MPPPQASVTTRNALLGLGLAVLLLASGCGLAAPPSEVPQTTIFPKSDGAHIINNLYVLIFVLATIVFFLVQGGLVYILWRYRYREGHPLPEQVHGNTKLEIGWTIGPAIVLLAIAIPTIQAIFALESPPDIGEPGQQVAGSLPIEVIGHQWWWEFRYPEQNIVSANELVVPVGRTVELRMRSDDVIHSWWVPQLMGKQDVMPAHVNILWFTAIEAGQYRGQCAEYCGIQHALMRMTAIVHSQADWDAWVARNQRPAQPTTDLAQQGAEVFSRNACVGCHAIQGTNAQSRIGPDLSHFGSRTTLAAGILDNTPENLARWLRNPQEVKEGNKMPNLNLRPQEVDALVEYLYSLK